MTYQAKKPVAESKSQKTQASTSCFHAEPSLLQRKITNSSKVVQQAKMNEKAANYVQRQPNRTGMPDRLKNGIENLSGYAMDDVRVHYNSPKPAQLQAHAYAQGTDIHLGPGQEKHLPHEAWHVVQQKQGRVQPTMQMKGIQVNDNPRLEREADVMGDKSSGLTQLVIDQRIINRGTLKSDNVSGSGNVAQGMWYKYLNPQAVNPRLIPRIMRMMQFLNLNLAYPVFNPVNLIQQPPIVNIPRFDYNYQILNENNEERVDQRANQQVAADNEYANVDINREAGLEELVTESFNDELPESDISKIDMQFIDDKLLSKAFFRELIFLGLGKDFLKEMESKAKLEGKLKKRPPGETPDSNPEDEGARARLIKATKNYDEGTIGYGVHTSTRAIKTIFQELGASDIDVFFAQEEVKSLLQKPVEDTKSLDEVAKLEYEFWKKTKEKEGLDEKFGGTLGSMFKPEIRSVIMKYMSKIPKKYLKDSP